MTRFFWHKKQKKKASERKCETMVTLMKQLCRYTSVIYVLTTQQGEWKWIIITFFFIHFLFQECWQRTNETTSRDISWFLPQENSSKTLQLNQANNPNQTLLKIGVAKNVLANFERVSAQRITVTKKLRLLKILAPKKHSQSYWSPQTTGEKLKIDLAKKRVELQF